MTLVLKLFTTHATAQTLTQRIDARLDAAGLDRNFWGVAVVDMNGTVLYNRNAGRLFMPASNTKLAVTTAALSLLGPDFRVTTSVYGTGAVVAGVLQGDLILYGRGDPTFSRRCYRLDSLAPGACDRDPAVRLKDLAQQLAKLGLKSVKGDLIGDGTWFEEEHVHRTWESYDLGWYFAAPVSGLGFNDNALDVRTAASNAIGSKPTITVTPDLEYAAFISKAVVAASTARRTYDIFRSPDGLSYTTVGDVPAGTALIEYPAVSDPDRYTAFAFRAALKAEGVTINGTIRSVTDSTITRTARASAPLAEVRSRPLSEWLFPILNSSQNLFAETMLKQLGHRVSGVGSWKEGIAAERRFLIDSVRIDSTHFSLADGSGLSDKNLITPLAFTAMLRHLWKSPQKEVFLAGLPRSGQQGTLKNRFLGTPLEGRVRAKSGSIGGVNAISGYVERPDGKVYVFSIIANHHTMTSTRMIGVLDGIVLEIGK